MLVYSEKRMPLSSTMRDIDHVLNDNEMARLSVCIWIDIAMALGRFDIYLLNFECLSKLFQNAWY